MVFTDLGADEIERRRRASIAAMKALERERFNKWYQEICDKKYWETGPCCAGCDHWQSEAGNIGKCSASALVSGSDVKRSLLGTGFCSYKFSPGLPYTKAEFYCGDFQDNFVWSGLDREYLVRIGAFKDGKMLPNPQRPHIRK